MELFYQLILAGQTPIVWLQQVVIEDLEALFKVVRTDGAVNAYLALTRCCFIDIFFFILQVFKHLVHIPTFILDLLYYFSGDLPQDLWRLSIAYLVPHNFLPDLLQFRLFNMFDLHELADLLVYHFDALYALSLHQL